CWRHEVATPYPKSHGREARANPFSKRLIGEDFAEYCAATMQPCEINDLSCGESGLETARVRNGLCQLKGTTENSLSAAQYGVRISSSKSGIQLTTVTSSATGSPGLNR